MKPAEENRSVREIDGLRPKLRAGLRFSIQEQGGRRVCVIEDPVASRFHRVGLEECRFLRSLDGSLTVAGLLAKLARNAGESWSEAEATQMLRWARDQHLLALESDRARPEREHTERVWRTALTWLNPLTVKWPLGRPDRFFAKAAAALSPVLGWGGWCLWLLVLIVGAAQLAPEWPRFTAEASGLLSRDNWLWLLLAWAGLKVAHEFGHGLLCKHFGAAVREVGIIFVLFMPMGYVDATASIGLPSKWQRIAVSLAGVGVEFFLAAVAAVVWVHTEPGAVHTVAHNVVITGTIVTLIFNANPLMRFDGYFVLSDLLELPNLATRGRQWVQRALVGLLGGAHRRSREEKLVAAYGVAALLWQIVVMGGLLVGASVLLRGGGLALAALGALTWAAGPLLQFGRSLQGARQWGQAAWRIALAALVIGAALAVPWHRSVSSPGVVEFAETLPLRAECPGFVDAVHVRDGEAVPAGALLVELRNEEVAAQLARARLDLQRQELQARLAYTREEISVFQAEEAKAESLRQSVAQKERYLSTLQIRAPFAGRVTNRLLANLHGAYFSAGEEVIRLGQADGVEVKIAVDERDAAHFRGAVGGDLQVRVEGRGSAEHATLTRMEARASREVAMPALTALAGGPLALRPIDQAERQRGESYELAEPHFTATARLSRENLGLFPGETARVRFRSGRTVTLWAEMESAVRRWLGRYAEARQS